MVLRCVSEASIRAAPVAEAHPIHPARDTGCRYTCGQLIESVSPLITLAKVELPDSWYWLQSMGICGSGME